MSSTNLEHHPIETYRQFWPYYLREHSKTETRAIHYLGTAIASLAVALFAATGNFWYVPLALVGGYGPAWFAHFFVEKNRPATFAYPLWSLISDFRMAFRFLTGALERDLADAGVADRR